MALLLLASPYLELYHLVFVLDVAAHRRCAVRHLVVNKLEVAVRHEHRLCARQRGLAEHHQAVRYRESAIGHYCHLADRPRS